MESIISLIVTLVIIVVALKIILKVTGCFVKILIAAAAIYLIFMALNYGFNIFSFMI